MNDANFESFPVGYQRILKQYREAGFSSRYSSAMVGDVHRALPKGGIFAASAPNGKLRLMCERNPLGMVIAQAGSKVMSGTGEVIDMKPTDLNQHVPIALDSPTNVDAMLKALHDADA